MSAIFKSHYNIIVIIITINFLVCFCSGAAGGLTNLSKMPSCNILVLGAQRKTLSGFSSVATNPHTGYIYYSDIVQATNPVSSMSYFLCHSKELDQML